MLITQLPPALRLVPQVVLAIENWLFPERLQARLTRVAVPVFVTVSAIVLLVPRSTSPKFKLVGLSETTGAFTTCDAPADVLEL